MIGDFFEVEIEVEFEMNYTTKSEAIPHFDSAQCSKQANKKKLTLSISKIQSTYECLF